MLPSKDWTEPGRFATAITENQKPTTSRGKPVPLYSWDWRHCSKQCLSHQRQGEPVSKSDRRELLRIRIAVGAGLDLFQKDVFV